MSDGASEAAYENSEKWKKAYEENRLDDEIKEIQRQLRQNDRRGKDEY